MPIKIPNDLPATQTLNSENIFVMTETRAMTQDIRPLQILLLNLRPTKVVTETQLARLLGNTPLQVEMDLLMVESHVSKNTSADHMLAFYKTFDQVRDNTYIGLRTMVEALGRVGTAAQKDAAPRVLQAMRDYQVSTSENYELESTHIAQLVQQLELQPLSDDCTTLAITALVSQLKTENQQVQTLIAPRNEQQAGIDAQAMQRARQQSDLVYVETVMVINAFSVVEQQQGASPYDHAIDVVNQDQEYYVLHVFPKAKLKKVKITDEISFYFTTNETWKKAAEQHPEENAGWTVTEDDELLYQTQRLLDAQGNAVDATKKVDDTKQYQLEQPAPDSDVTPESE